MAIWKHSFFAKLLAGNLLLIALLVIVGGLISYREIDQTQLEMGRLDQERTVGIVADCIQHAWPQTPATQPAPDTQPARPGEHEMLVTRIDAICKRLMAESPMRMTVVAADGQVLGDSDFDPAGMENHCTQDRKEILAALEGQPGASVRASETAHIPFRYLARPVRAGGKVVAAVRVAMPVRNIVASESFLRRSLLLAGAAAVAAALLLALLLSWIWYAPLRQITRTAKALAGGDLSHRAPVSGADELGQLAASLNEMRDNIGQQITQIAAQRKNLLSVLDNLREGVIGLDSDGRILLANHSAIDLLAADHTGPILNQHLQIIVRNPEVVDAYSAAVRTGRSVNCLIEANRAGRRMTLDVHARKLPAGDDKQIGGIMVVRDVTDIARSAAMKAEVVANASHELRTPLATIRAAVDSLAFCGIDDPEAFAKCLAIINRHLTRLENMTNDLLDLNVAESGRTRLRTEDVTIDSLGEWVESHFAAKAGEKKVSLGVQTAQCDKAFRTERRLLELIVQNLVDNAIKYTPAGGSVKVELSCGDDCGELTVRVNDTGCGIRPEDRPRIFERFFQADPARSGDTAIRGTGLGLAIVKHACERLGARIAIDSEVGKGTKVTLTVPPTAEG
jgi:two-component system, OmpR family, phosphate regulon sensor histidine kinase PhoR